MDGVISREKWYEKAAQLAGASDPFATDLGEKQKEIVAAKLQSILEQLDHARKLCENQGGDTGWSEKLQYSHVSPVVRCFETLRSRDWDSCVEAIRNFQKPTTYKPRGLPESIAALIQNTAKNAVSEFERQSIPVSLCNHKSRLS